MATFSTEQKRRIYDHLQQTTEFVSDPNNRSNMSNRKQRILEYLERSRG